MIYGHIMLEQLVLSRQLKLSSNVPTQYWDGDYLETVGTITKLRPVL